MPAIQVSDVQKKYTVAVKTEGLWASIQSLFNRKYRTVTAVNKISFSIEQGEVVGFIGKNGAGKTTTLKMLSGLLHPTSGQVQVLGYTPHERQAEYQRQFSLIMGQKNQLWWDLPAVETFRLHKEIYQISNEAYADNLSTLVELMGIEDILDVQVRKLSLGQRMKCELVAALLHTPKVLFLDEPTIGLDVVVQKNIRDFIKRYNQQYKATIILTSHYMDDVKELCDRIIIIDSGKIYYDGKLQQVIDQYARNKIITVLFDTQISQDKLKKYGKVTKYDAHTATITVDRKKAMQCSAALLQDLELTDITIEEPSIEAIIREVFEANKQ